MSIEDDTIRGVANKTKTTMRGMPFVFLTCGFLSGTTSVSWTKKWLNLVRAALQRTSEAFPGFVPDFLLPMCGPNPDHPMLVAPMPWYLSHRFGFVCVVFWFWCVVCFFFVFCVLLVFGAWFLFVFCFGSVLVTLRLNAGLCIGPLPVHFMRPLIRRQPANAVINQLILFCDMQLNM